MSRVYIFTVSFPYGEKGENFIYDELEYIAEKFDEVIIVPTYIHKSSKRLPYDNVKINESLARDFANIKAAFYALTDKNFYKEVFKVPSILISLHKIKRVLSFFGRGKAVYKFLKTNYQDGLLYSYWFNGVTYGFYKFKKEFNVPFIYRMHGSDLYLYANQGYLPFRKEILEDADAAFAISNDGKEYVKKTFTKKANIEVARLGVKNFCRQKIKKENKYIHIVSCSYVKKVKNVDKIYAVLLDVSKCLNIPVHWTHIGDGPLFGRLKKIAKPDVNLKVDLKGYMTKSEIQKFYNEAHIDLFINLSDSEGIPVSIMEAMCCGIPVVAKDIGGVSEIVNNENGILCQKDESLKEISKKIIELLRNKNNLSLKREKARNSWEQYYNADKNYRCFADRIHRIACENIKS